MVQRYMLDYADFLFYKNLILATIFQILNLILELFWNFIKKLKKSSDHAENS